MFNLAILLAQKILYLKNHLNYFYTYSLHPLHFHNNPTLYLEIHYLLIEFFLVMSTFQFNKNSNYPLFIL